MIRTRRLFLDSRHGVGPPENVQFNLVRPISNPEGVVCHLTNVVISNAWPTISSTNRKIFIVERTAGGALSARDAFLPIGPADSDTLKVHLENALNEGKSVSGSYSVTRSTGGAQTGTATAYRYYTVSLSGGGEFWIPPDSTLSDPAFRLQWITEYGGFPYIPGDLSSSEEIFQGFSTAGGVRRSTEPEFATTHRSGFVDLRSKHSILFCSSDLQTPSHVDVRGKRDILLRVPVTTGYGALTVHSSSGDHEYIELANRDITTLSFQLRDAHHNLVEGVGHWTAEIIFCYPPR